MNYDNPPKPVDGFSFVVTADGKRVLTVSTKTGTAAYEFDEAQWKRLGETADWFAVHKAREAERKAKEERRRRR